jgi:hypothetical protein
MGWANMHTHLDGEAEATREIPQKIKKTPLGEIHGQAPSLRFMDSLKKAGPDAAILPFENPLTS